MEKLEEQFRIKKELLTKETKPEMLFRANNIICSKIHNNMSYIFSNKKMFEIDGKENLSVIPDAAIIWGEQPIENNIKLVNYAFSLKLPLFIAENSFIRSAYCWDNGKIIPKKFSDAVSFIISNVMYFDAINISEIEKTLQDTNFSITKEQKQRARRLIDKIVSNHLTKYNHQPIFTPNIGRDGVKKVLVIDQAYRDMSIQKGLANDYTFENMLKCAIEENPDADIIVKTHPDVMKKTRQGYYQGLKSDGRVYVLTDPINPISLIEYSDKVYVCSSQFGFEALMCGKEVHTFGMPFYAGWGLTKDRIQLKRRTAKRSLEEIFYVAYIMYSYWVNPDKKCRCEIEDALDYILKLRNELFVELENNRKIELKQESQICEYLNNSSKNIIFWGASLFLEGFLTKYKIKNSNILGIIDKNEDRQGTTIGDYKVFPPEKLQELQPDMVICSVKNNHERVYPIIREYLEQNYPNIEFLPDVFE